MKGEAHVAVLEKEVPAAEAGGGDGDEDLVAGQGWSGCFGLDDVSGAGAFEDCKGDFVGTHLV